MANKANDEMSLLEDSRVSGEKVGYMELQGAVKDADCHKVKVDGGVASVLGCCNIFEHRDGAEKKFSCGTCEYVKGKSNGKQK